MAACTWLDGGVRVPLWRTFRSRFKTQDSGFKSRFNMKKATGNDPGGFFLIMQSQA
jgi:hypothetical protein